MMLRRSQYRALVLGVIVLVALVGASCGDDDTTEAPTTTAAPATTTESPATSQDATTTEASTTTASAATTAASSTTEAPAAESEVAIYFVSGEALAAAGRTVAGDDVALAAVEALLAGPDQLETDIGYRTQIPAGTEVIGVDITEGVATVDLTSTFESGGGSLSMLLRVAQVVQTVGTLPGVEEVRFALDGEPVEAIGGEGILVDGVTPEDVQDQWPLIFPSVPTPGQEVSSPLRVAGAANTSESTLAYTLTDPEGLIIAEGSAMATAGTGTWGTFEFEIDFDTDRSGLGALILSDPGGGEGQPYLVEIPVRM